MSQDEERVDTHALVYRGRADYWLREWPHTMQGLGEASGLHPAEVANTLAAMAWDQQNMEVDELIGRFASRITPNL